MRKFAEASLDVLTFSRDGEAPIHRQVYSAIRGYILDRRLPSGAKLPATRDLAKQLGVGRNTIVAAYDQLLAEGYLEARAGSCTRVAQLPAARGSSSSARTGVPSCGLSRRGKQIADLPQPHRSRGVINLYPGVPETATFPFSVWAKLLARSARKNDDDIVGIHDYAGHPRLRTAIAQYLGTARGVACEAEQVIVVTGAQAALDLVSRILVDDGDWAWMEEPGYRGARTALLGGGARLAPLRVSRAGWRLDAPDLPKPRAIYVTPSCQWPFGMAMRMDERLRLLALAERHNCWIIEDDYDGEYRFRGQPVPALRALDGADHVVYVGTFGKTMFSSLRLGFLVVPRALAPAFGAALSVSGHFASPLLQAAVADFILEGHFSSHLKRMRRLYATRQERFVDLCRRRLRPWATVEENDSGMQVFASLAPGFDDRHVAEVALRHGVDVQPVSIDYHCDEPQNGLLLGFAALDQAEAERGVIALCGAFLEIETGARV